MYASSLVRSRPNGAGQTCGQCVSRLRQTGAASSYHRRATVSRDRLALGGCGLRARLIDRQVTGDRPLGAADRLCSLVELRRHVEVVNCRLATIDAIEADKRVDLKVCKVEVDVDGVEAGKEVDERLLLRLRDMLQESVGDRLARRNRLVHTNLEGQRLGVDVTNVDTTFMGEEDVIAVTVGVDANVVFGVGRVGEERLYDEVVESARDGLDLD